MREGESKRERQSMIGVCRRPMAAGNANKRDELTFHRLEIWAGMPGVFVCVFFTECHNDTHRQ